MHQYDSNLTCVRYLYDLDETEAEPAQDGEAPKADDGLGKRNPTEMDKGGEVDNTFETGVFIVTRASRTTGAKGSNFFCKK